MKKITSVICLMFALLMIFALPVSASAPYQTYTYSINGKALYSPEAYTPVKTIDSAYMGLTDVNNLVKFYPQYQITEDMSSTEQKAAEEALKAKAVAISNPSDLEVDENQNVYVVDTDNNRVIVLDRYYKVKFILDEFINAEGIADSFSSPQGVFISSSKHINGEDVPGKIYVCDTNAARIVTFDLDGNFLGIVPRPESELFGQDAIYKPVAVAVDQYDRMYVVSTATYEGIIVMTEDGAFTGFIGAQKASVSAWNALWRRFQSEEQRAQSQKILSKEFNNITINSDGFIYVTTSSIEENKVISTINNKSKDGTYAPVKMLNAAGDEIMRRNGFYPPSGEIDMTKVSVTDKLTGASTVTDVAVGPENTWSIVDQKRSKVFTYDYDGNLLYAFGDQGGQLGNITLDGLNAVTYQGTNMLLMDTRSKSFTVYQRTEYGDILARALRNQNERRFDKAIEDWMEILKRNSNFDTAYISIGNALYRSGKYDSAMENFRMAYDTENYSNAYAEVRKEWISKFIILIPVGVIVLVLAWSMLMKYAKKINKRAATKGGSRTYKEELLYVFHLMFHPFDGFWDLKHEKRGSMRAAMTILGVTLVAFYYHEIGIGYVFNPQEKYGTIFTVALSVLLPLFLFVIANWCLTTLFEGEGSFKDILIACCYSLAPMILVLIPVTIASNFVLAKEMDILELLIVVGFIWLAMLVFVGTMVTHDYSLGKNFLIVLCTILGMVVIMFVALLFTTLLGKLVSFVTNIVTELRFRA